MCSNVFQCKLWKTKEKLLCGAKAKYFTVFSYFHKLRYLPLLQSSTTQPTRPNISILTLGPEASQQSIPSVTVVTGTDPLAQSHLYLVRKNDCLEKMSWKNKLSKHKFNKRDMMRIVDTKKDSFFITVIRVPNKGPFPLIRPAVIMGQCLIGRAVRWL